MRQICYLLRVQYGNGDELTVYEDRRRASLALAKLAAQLASDYEIRYHHADDRFLTSITACRVSNGLITRLIVATIDSHEVQ